MDGKSWPADLNYLKCNSNNLTALVRNNVDLRKAFTDVTNRFVSLHPIDK